MTALDDAMERCWFDVVSNVYSEGDAEDLSGLNRVSLAQLSS